MAQTNSLSVFDYLVWVILNAPISLLSDVWEFNIFLCLPVWPVATCTWLLSTTSPSVSPSTLSSSSTLPHVNYWSRSILCSSSSWSSQSSFCPSGKVNASLAWLYIFVIPSVVYRVRPTYLVLFKWFRDASGHSGEVWGHSSDQPGGLFCGRGNRCRRLPELHHLHWDVLCCCGSAPRIYLQGLHG